MSLCETFFLISLNDENFIGLIVDWNMMFLRYIRSRTKQKCKTLVVKISFFFRYLYI